ncbi:MAG: hypothetical protein C5B51_05600 [Terriglobia bacterium]|nr:MAG: hypothetical protein C5B51_05600 [Terriglobia bacterium]
MSHCWSEGELRAYVDRELSAADMQRVAAHVEECPVCTGVYADVEARAVRVTALLTALPEPEPVGQLPHLPRRPLVIWPWAAGVAAAALALAFFALPRPADPIAVAPLPPPRAPQVLVPPRPAVKPAIIRRVVPVKPKPKPEQQYYVKLDDEPIESGIVVRVGLEGGQLPADVILGPDGRPRAIRLVSDFSGER